MLKDELFCEIFEIILKKLLRMGFVENGFSIRKWLEMLGYWNKS